MSQTGKEKGDSIIVASSILAVAQIIVRIISLVYRIPMIRIVGAEGMGYYANAYEVYQFLLLVSSNGIPVAFSLLSASYLAKREYKNLQRLLKGTMVFAGMIGFVLAALTFFGAGYFQGKNSMMPTAISQIIEQIIHAVVSVAAAWLLIGLGPSMGAAGGTLGTFLGAVGGLGFCVLIYHLYEPTVRRMLRKDRTPRRDLITYHNVFKLVALTMAPIILSQTMYQLGGVVDALLFHNILDGIGYSASVRAELIGIYSGEYKLLINVPLALTSSIGIALIPTVTRSVTQHKKREVYGKINQIIRLTMVVALPCCAGLMVIARPIMQLVFADSSQLASSLLVLGAPTIAFYSLSTVTISILQGIHRMRAPVIHSTIAMAVHAGALAVLLRFADMNIYAFIYGNYVFAFIMCILNLRALKKYIGYRQEYKRSVFIPIIICLIMAIFTRLIYSGIYTLTGSLAAGVAAAIVIAVIIYGLLTVITGVLSEDDLMSMPKGRSIVNICRKIHIL